jgi:hypothetical protein
MRHLSSRKFIVAILALVSDTALCWGGHIDPGVFATVMVATVGAYLTANVAQKKVTA